MSLCQNSKTEQRQCRSTFHPIGMMTAKSHWRHTTNEVQHLAKLPTCNADEIKAAVVSTFSRGPRGSPALQQYKRRLWLQALKRKDWKDATAVKSGSRLQRSLHLRQVIIHQPPSVSSRRKAWNSHET